jgi:hypothetical protein
MTLGHFLLQDLAGLLVGSNLSNSASVTLVATKGLCKKKLYQPQNFLLGVLPGSKGHDVGIVM